MKELNEIVGGNLQELRKSRHLTQQELAEQVGYSDKSISKWELGKAIPTVDILIDLASFFGVTVDYIITERSPGEVQKSMNETVKKRSNQIILLALVVCVIYAIAAAVYVTNVINPTKPDLWISFVWAIPITFFFLSALNYHFWKRSISFHVFVSLFCWTIIMAFHIQYLCYPPYDNLWYLYLLGIPIQVAIVLMANLK